MNAALIVAVDLRKLAEQTPDATLQSQERR